MIKFCSLFSGSSGNCIFINCGRTKLLLDAGLSMKRIKGALDSIGESISDINAILISHEHIDHTRGAGIISRKYSIPVYANIGTWSSMESITGEIEEKNIKFFNTGEEFEIQDFNIKAFSIPHDAKEPVGFNLFAGGKKITVATDTGHMNRQLLGCFEKSDLLMMESNHDVEMLRIGPYPWSLKQRILGDRGHLSNEVAGKTVAWLAQQGCRRFLLGHLSRENNFPQLAWQTVFNALTENGIRPGKDVMLDVMLRDQAGCVVTL